MTVVPLRKDPGPSSSLSAPIKGRVAAPDLRPGRYPRGAADDSVERGGRERRRPRDNSNSRRVKTVQTDFSKMLQFLKQNQGESKLPPKTMSGHHTRLIIIQKQTVRPQPRGTSDMHVIQLLRATKNLHTPSVTSSQTTVHIIGL